MCCPIGGHSRGEVEIPDRPNHPQESCRWPAPQRGTKMMNQHLREQLERLQAVWPALAERDRTFITAFMDALCDWIEAGQEARS
jgi:hypothetical protein